MELLCASNHRCPEGSAAAREQGHALRIYATADRNREKTEDEVMVRMEGLIAPDALGTFEIQGDVRVEHECWRALPTRPRPGRT